MLVTVRSECLFLFFAEMDLCIDDKEVGTKE